MFDSNVNSMNSAFNNLETSATRISQAGWNKDIDLGKESVEQIQDKHAVAANIKVIQVQDDTLKSLLDMKG